MKYFLFGLLGIWSLYGHTFDMSCIGIGNKHFLVISQQGKILSFGDSEYGQLGHKNTKTVENEPKLIEALKDRNAIEVAAGEDFSLMLMDDGTVLSCGSNDEGQLGYETEHKDFISLPCQITGLSHVIQIAAAFKHAAALTNSGDAFFWGDNQVKPRLMTGLKNKAIKKIALGYNFLLAIDNNNMLWSLRCNDKNNELECKGTEQQPYKVCNNSIKDVAIGKQHVILLTTEKEVFSYGKNSLAQLGHKDWDSYENPKKIDVLKDIEAITAGPDFSIALDKKGIWFFGAHVFVGMTFNFHLSPIRLPQTAGLSISGVKASPSGTLLLALNDGKMITHKRDKEFKTFNEIINIKLPHWTKDTHWAHRKSTQNTVFTLLLIQKSYRVVIIPKVLIFLICEHLGE